MRNDNQRRRRRLFLKTFFITITSCLALILIGWLTIKNAIKPPVIQGSTADTHYTADSQPAYSVPEPAHEDTLIDSSLVPDGFDPTARKPFFYTFLIFGLDEGVNTDSLMVAAYDGANKKAYIIGIPRDSKVNVKRSIKKINAAYPAGRSNGGGMEGGIDQLKREIKTIIGFMPDYTICINFNAFKRVVDAVNGVEVNVEYDMVYDDPAQNLHINIPKGLRTLSGEEALKFARYRHGNTGYKTITDYQRIENQQAVIKAVLSKLLTPASILKIPEFVNIFTENVYTDMKLEHMLYFADEFVNISGTDALESYTIPTTGTSGKPNWYELLDEAAIVELVNQTINPYLQDIEAKNLDITD